MRIACRLAIVLCLSFPSVRMVGGQQDPASPANPAPQTQVPPAPKENAPADQVPADQVPAETTPAAPANPQTPAAGEQEPESAPKKKTDAVAASPTRKRRKRTASAPDGVPRKIVVREGGAREPAAQIAPDITPAEAARQRQNAEDLLGSTDDQLKGLAARPLDVGRQETVGQIRNYMDGARLALKEGDVRRASTLAQKAHLLAEDLVKH